MPICWFAVFDWEFEKDYLIKNPKTFELGLYDKCFNAFEFWKSYVMAATEGLLLVLITFDTVKFSTTTDWLSRYFREEGDEGSALAQANDVDYLGYFLF